MRASDVSSSCSVRPPAHAGRFYPAEPMRLLADIRGYLDSAGAIASGPTPKAVIVPHAGYVFSGPIAGSAYTRLRGAAGSVHRVVLVGPAHYVLFDGLATTACDYFATPLGLVPVDAGTSSRLGPLGCVQSLEAAHQPEHSLEVQLPFLQTVLEEFSIVPLLVGRATDADVQAALEALWGGPETIIVVSSDLSHYHDGATAQRLDLATARRIEAFQAERIADADACGGKAIRGLLTLARGRGLHCKTLDLRNSGDTAGSRDRVVGYGAFVFT